MTSKPDLGAVIAIVSAIAVVGAIIAGVVAVGGPGQARDQRLDDARYEAMGAVASAAQCVYAATGALPASIGEARVAIGGLPSGARGCEETWLSRDVEALISYEVAAPDQINLCAEFRRPATAERRDQRLDVYEDRFPELAAPRRETGRRCYLIRVSAP